MSEETYKRWGVSLGLSRNMFFEKEEKIEKYFLWKEKDITKSIAIENVEPTKRKWEVGKYEILAESGPKTTGSSKDFAAWKLHD